ncbi:MAG: UDP-4-amino-4,6-dideoxy-N-acetyl-beta-L-altrosamine transaminase [Candidatus Scalindua sp.]|jgi:UDP-4-amino-4,6-dideoxy-N-acetyl-beta-L-altrosamine transaminase/dTDP-4-dehydrorhamnose reductase|nr:UDP-4-amino-4,6-dideoxy-N-acetyl-beta-L-altrosamine transaminase [Candidatus Scalindua sp.]MBT6563728.1 UDP-4-amino-4,6-dideoxy-N-acetyl-beta-L-altrosamine transaminase [Candidatus Scalindua sp.]
MDSAKTKLLITGVSGLLGNNLAYYFKDKYEILGLYNSHPVIIDGIRTGECDITCKDSVIRVINEFNPSIILHCASITDIEQCERDKDIAEKINVLSTTYLTKSVIDQDVKLVYISTDAVYDGVRGGSSESDKVNPLNFYGRSKYEGELEIAKKENALIFRTNIFGWNIQNKKSLGEWVLDELQSNRRIKGFKDACFSSIYTLEFARIIDIAIRQGLSGVYNCGSADSCSKYEFATKIADCFGFDKALISPTSIDDFDFQAERGKRLDLNVNKLQRKLDYRFPTVDQSIEAFYKDYKCGLPNEIKRNISTVQDQSAIIPYGRQWIDENDIQEVISLMRSERITQGPKVEEFEDALAECCGAKYAVAVNSGTSALHIACLAAEVKEGDEVITSPITFVASANCAIYCGAKPVFADIDLKTYNVAIDEIRNKINTQTRAVIPVHFAGQSCDMESIRKVIKNKEEEFGNKIFIIEDASHALGSSYKGKNVGSCTFSDMTVMSFHPVKHITTGEGGAVLTNDEILYKKLKRLRSHGITNTPEDFVYKDQAFGNSSFVGLQSAIENPQSVNPWYYEQVDLGYNYRITDIQCALGISQLRKLHDFCNRRQEIANMYNEAFSGIESIQIPFESEDCSSNFHLYVLLFDFRQIGIERTKLMIELKQRGIQTQVHYIPVHTQPFYQERFGTKWGDCPNAEIYYQKCLSFPLFPAMSDIDVEYVISTILWCWQREKNNISKDGCQLIIDYG